MGICSMDWRDYFHEIGGILSWLLLSCIELSQQPSCFIVFMSHESSIVCPRVIWFRYGVMRVLTPTGKFTPTSVSQRYTEYQHTGCKICFVTKKGFSIYKKFTTLYIRTPFIVYRLLYSSSGTYTLMVVQISERLGPKVTYNVYWYGQ